MAKKTTTSKRAAPRRKKSSALFSFGDITYTYTPSAMATTYRGDCLELLAQIPESSIQLIVTSPPYNIGKRYEKRSTLTDYLRGQEGVIRACSEKLAPGGSICWQIGNHVTGDGIVPLDILLYPIFTDLGFVLRNRIVWHFEHGLHCNSRLSGRYETILWFTRPGKDYVFNLDPIRVPQKYPGKKYFKGPKAGQYSANPLGKNPGDVWVIPNVKHNHVEKTAHPCQFPVELVERLVLALSNEGDLVVDPFMGAGSTLVAALMNRRRSAGETLCPNTLKLPMLDCNKHARHAANSAPQSTCLYAKRVRYGCALGASVSWRERIHRIVMLSSRSPK